MPTADAQISITLSRATWLDLARTLTAFGCLEHGAFLMRAIRPGCQNGHAPEERFVRPNGELRCHACQQAAGARQRAEGPRFPESEVG